MRRALLPRRLAAALLAAGLGAALPAGPALLGIAPAAAETARPTVDPSAPTPSVPYPGLPPQGSAPDGSTVGGEGLDTRGVVTVDGAPPLPAGIDARGWLVADAGTGQVLGAQDPHGRYYPASTLKTLTLLTLAHRLDPALVVTGTPEDEAVEGSRVGLVRGGQYSVDLLFRALMMQSGNDAANALARAAGGVPGTLAAMNATAARLGATDTVAGTPSGLDVAGQSSSPYDLALVMRQLVEDPYTRDVLQTPVAQLPGVPGLTPGYQIQNQDTLLATYPGTLGGKTGFTDAARHTFVAAVERDGRRLVVSVMQAERRPVHELDQATRLLDWGFATPRDAAGVGRLVDPGQVDLTSTGDARTDDDTDDATDDDPDTTGAAERTATAPPPPVATPSTSEAAAATSTGAAPVAVPAALAAGALAVVVATVVGRRRAVRPLPTGGPVSRPPGPPRHAAPPGGPAAGGPAGSPAPPPAPRSPADPPPPG